MKSLSIDSLLIGCSRSLVLCGRHIDRSGSEMQQADSASLSKKAGVDPKVASDQRGHRIGVSLEVYTSSYIEQKRAALRKLDAAVLLQTRTRTAVCVRGSAFNGVNGVTTNWWVCRSATADRDAAPAFSPRKPDRRRRPRCWRELTDGSRLVRRRTRPGRCGNNRNCSEVLAPTGG